MTSYDDDPRIYLLMSRLKKLFYLPTHDIDFPKSLLYGFFFINVENLNLYKII